VILPQKNARDLEDVPKEARDAIEFILADDMSQVIAAALEAPGEAAPRAGRDCATLDRRESPAAARPAPRSPVWAGTVRPSGPGSPA